MHIECRKILAHYTPNSKINKSENAKAILKTSAKVKVCDVTHERDMKLKLIFVFSQT